MSKVGWKISKKFENQLSPNNKQQNKSINFGDIVYLNYTIRVLQKQSILGHSSPKKLKVILTGSSLAGSTVSVRPFGSDDISFYDSLFCIEPVYSTKHDYARLHSGEIYRESEVRCEHKNQRQKVYFGDKIQLRHLSSGKLIVLDPSIVMPESTGWGIKTSKGGDTFEFMRVMSSGRDNKLGYMCNYREGLRLVFKFSGLKYYLHARNYRTEDESNEWEVSAHYSPVTWRINKYVSFNTRPDLIRYGVPLKIGQRFHDLRLSCAGREELMQSRADSPIDAFQSGQSSQINLNNSQYDWFTIWILERKDNLYKGGEVKWGDQVYIRSLITGNYLTKDLKMSQERLADNLFTINLPARTSKQFGLFYMVDIILRQQEGLTVAGQSNFALEHHSAKLFPKQDGSNDNFVYAYVTVEDINKSSDNCVFHLRGIYLRDIRFIRMLTELRPRLKQFISRLRSWIDQRGTNTFGGVYNLQSYDTNITYKFYMAYQWIIILYKAFKTAKSTEYENRQLIAGNLQLTELIIQILSLVSVKKHRTLQATRGHNYGIRLIMHLVSHFIEELNPLRCNLLGVNSLLVSRLWKTLLIMIKDNKTVCLQCSKLTEDLCRLLTFDQSAAGVVLTEIFRHVDIKEHTKNKMSLNEYYQTWCTRLDSISESNLGDQEIFLRLMAQLASVDNDPIPEYQQALAESLFDEDFGFPVLRLVNYGGQLSIKFFIKSDEFNDVSFIEMNPSLAHCSCVTPEGMTYSLTGISLLESYSIYVYQAINLFNTLCVGEQVENKQYVVEELGFKQDLLMRVIMDNNIHLCIRQAFLSLTETLVIMQKNTIPIRVLLKDITFTYDNLLDNETRLFDYDLQNDPNPISENCVAWIIQLWTSPNRNDIDKDLIQNLNFILTALNVTYQLINQHYIIEQNLVILTKPMTYILIGFSDKSKLYINRHWTVPIIQTAFLELRKSIEIKHKLKDVMHSVLQILKIIEGYKLRKQLSFILKYFVKDHQISQSSIKNLLSQKLYENFTEFETTINPFLAKKSQYQIKVAYIMEEEPDEIQYISLLLPINISLLQVGQSVGNILLKLLHSHLNYTKQLYNRLQRVDIIRSRGLIGVRDALQQWILIGTHKEIIRKMAIELDLNYQGKFNMLKLIHEKLLELISFIHQCYQEDVYCFGKFQNLLRHMGIHKLLVKLLKSCNEAPVQKLLDPDTKLGEIRSAAISLLYYFAKDSKTNRKSLKLLVDTNFYDTTILRSPKLVQEITNFSNISIKDVKTYIEAVIADAINSDNYQKLGGLRWVSCLMYNRQGQPQYKIQVIVAQTIANIFFPYDHFGQHSTSTLGPSIILTLLAEAAFQNNLSCQIIREFLTADLLGDLFNQKLPLMVQSAILHMYYRSYIEPVQGIKQDHTAYALQPAIRWILDLLQICTENASSIEQIALQGFYSPVINKKNPEYQDLRWLLYDTNEILDMWSYLFDIGKSETQIQGIVTYLPELLKSPYLETDVRKAIKVQFDELFDELKEIARETESYLDFNILLLYMDHAQRAIRLREGFDRNFNVLKRLPSFLNSKRTQRFKQKIPQSIKHRVIPNMLTLNNTELDMDKEIDKKLLELFYSCSNFIDKQDINFQKQVISQLFESLPVFNRLAQGLLASIEFQSAINYLRIFKKIAKTSGQSEFYFKFLKQLVKMSKHTSKSFATVIYESNIIHEAIETIMQSNDINVQNSVASLLLALFKEQTTYFLLEFKKYLVESEISFTFFSFLCDLLDSAIDQATIKEDNTQKSEKQHLFQKTATKLINFLGLLCNNFDKEMQDFVYNQSTIQSEQISDQQLGGSINLVETVLNIFVELIGTQPTWQTIKQNHLLLIACMECLIDFMKGPCVRNQAFVGHQIELYITLNRLLGTLTDTYESELMNVYCVCIDMLFTLTEGNLNQCIMNEIIGQLKIDFFIQKAKTIYKQFIQGRELEIKVEIFDDNPRSQNFQRPLTHSDMGIIQTGLTIMKFVIMLKTHFPLHPSFAKLKQPDCIKQNKDIFSKLFMLNNFSVEKKWYTYYSKNIGYVELDYDGLTVDEYFIIPFKFQFLSTHTAQQIITSKTNDTHKEGLEMFLQEVELYHIETAHRQNLSKYKLARMLLGKWNIFFTISLLLVLTVNFIIVMQNDPEQDDNTETLFWILLLGLFQGTAYTMGFIIYLMEYAPIFIALGIQRMRDIDISAIWDLPYNQSVLMQDYLDDIHSKAAQFRNKNITSEHIRATPFKYKLLYLMNDTNTVYHTVYLSLSFVCIIYPLLYCILLLNIVKQNQDLLNVLRAVTQNKKQLMLTMVLALVCIYIFSVFGYRFFANFYDHSMDIDFVTYCESLFDCFLSTFNNGIRYGGGIGEALFPALKESNLYWQRMVFDILFFVVIVLMLLNIIFGIIIDTFAELRIKRQENLLRQFNTCFICGAERNLLELSGDGFIRHVISQHSIYAYTAFLIFIRERSFDECNGLERLVREKLKNFSVDFFPVKTKFIRYKESD